jgi:integral membrane protein
MPSSIGCLRIVSVIEGISFLALLCFAMPIKYIAQDPEPVRIIGMTHGILFILFLISLVSAWYQHQFSKKFLLLCLGCSLVPFAPFWLEALK